MSLFAVCSLKGAPGATTVALAMAAVLSHDHADAFLVEADPAGGDLCALMGLATTPGIMSLAAACRHHSATLDLTAHAQHLPGGGWGLLGPTDPDQASAILAALASRLGQGLAAASRHAVIDCGRWGATSPVAPLLREATATAVCIRATVPAIEAARVRADALREATGGRVGLVVVGAYPYGPELIERFTGLPVVGVVPIDRRGHTGLLGAARTGVDRSLLVRAARSIIDRIGQLAPRVLSSPVASDEARP